MQQEHVQEFQRVFSNAHGLKGVQIHAAHFHVFHASLAQLTLLPRGLLAEFTVVNRSERPLPVSPGWHPYFPCPDALKQRIVTDVPGLDPARFDPALEYDFGVPPAAHGRARFEVPGLGTLLVSHSPEMRHFQCWSLPGRDFVCLEPFTGPNNALNTPSRLEIPPGGGRTLFMRIELGG